MRLSSRGASRSMPVDRCRSIGAGRYGSLLLHHHAASQYPSRRAGTISAGTTAGGVDPGTPRSARYAPPSPRYAPRPLRLGSAASLAASTSAEARPTAAPGADDVLMEDVFGVGMDERKRQLAIEIERA